MPMKIFIDSADPIEIREALQHGCSGITTNPSLVSKQPKGEFSELLKQIIAVIYDERKTHNGPRYTQPKLPSLSVEVWAIPVPEIIGQASSLRSTLNYSELAIKIPGGWDELKAIREVSKYGYVNATCLFTEMQAIQCLEAGAHFVSIFWNRLKEIGGDPAKVISNLRKIMDRDYPEREIIAGSIGRSPSDVLDAALAGAHIATTSLKVIRELAGHPQTTKSVESFNKEFQAWMIKAEPSTN